MIRPQTAIVLSLVGYGFAVALAGVGVLLAKDTGARSAGLIFALVAGIFCVRPALPGSASLSRR